MPVVNVNLVLDEATYKGVMDGALELYGMVKDQKHRVRKHLPTVFDSAKEGASKAIDIVRNHKKELLIVGGLVIVGGTVIGTVSYFTQKEKRQAKKQFGKSLQVYLDAAQNGALTIDILDALISDLDTIAKLYKGEDVPLNISAKNLTALLNSIYEYTQQFAQANNVKAYDIKAPKRFKKNTVLDLQQYLKVQREILSKAA
jgi:hypothetical protein